MRRIRQREFTKLRRLKNAKSIHHTNLQLILLVYPTDQQLFAQSKTAILDIISEILNNILSNL
jgi:hypothetical protein